MHPKNNTPIRFYGRRRVRPLKGMQRDAMAQLPAWAFDPAQINHIYHNVLEIGFGGGEHIAAMAEKNPQHHFFCAEVFANGIASLSRLLTTHNIQNVGVYPNDVRLILNDFPDQCLDSLYLLFPDPWPKSRHAKRRFLQKETIEAAARLLKPGGLWHIASDHPIYQEWVVEQFQNQSFFVQTRLDPKERPDPALWPITRYEQKANGEGRTPYFWIWQRV